MILELFKVLIFRKEFREIFIPAECFQINKYRVALHTSRILHAKMIRVGKHGHDFFLNIGFFIRKVNAVAERFAHFGFAVDTRQTQACFVGRKHDLRIGQCLAVNSIEFVYNFFALLDHRHLILANRYMCCTESGDVCCLADRVTEKSNRNAGFKISHLNLGFYGRVTLYTCHCNKIHIIKCKLCQFRYHGLDKNRRFRRIDSACQIIQCNLNDILTYFFRMLCIVCQCLCICDHNINFIVITGVLKFHTFLQ